MKMIHKITLIAGVEKYYLPIDSKILCVKKQRESISIWYECHGGEAMEPRYFNTITTGQIINEKNLVYLGTVLLQDDNFVLHVYEVIID